MMADWAARAHRLPAGDTGAAVEEGYEAGEAEPVSVRRLPFELLEPPAVVALAPAAPDGNGHGPDESAVHTEPPVETMQESPALEVKASAEAATTPEATALEEQEKAAPPEPAAADEPPALLQAAHKALEAYNLGLAQELYHEALAQHPDDVAARSGLAQVLDARGEHEAALAQ